MEISKKRLIGRIGRQTAAHTILCVGALHGNEPAGVKALNSLFGQLSVTDIHPDYQIIGIIGNLKAFEQQKRFIDCDLNRVWAEGRGFGAELEEKQELLCIIENIEKRGRLSFIDLHTTSSETVPFAWDQNGKNLLAGNNSIPCINSFMHKIAGVLGGFLHDRGHSTLCCEGGSHQSTLAPQSLEDILWLSLQTQGVVKETAKVREAKARLYKLTNNIPRSLSIFYHHEISAEDQFVMQPGFQNFDRVSQGQLLATDRNGEILAPKDSLLMLPLYQLQGEDGFLLADGPT